jgi:hypothetical protein
MKVMQQLWHQICTFHIHLDQETIKFRLLRIGKLTNRKACLQWQPVQVKPLPH